MIPLFPPHVAAEETKKASHMKSNTPKHLVAALAAVVTLSCTVLAGPGPQTPPPTKKHNTRPNHIYAETARMVRISKHHKVTTCPKCTPITAAQPRLAGVGRGSYTATR